jgi:cysteine desulfuration protein SufE
MGRSLRINRVASRLAVPPKLAELIDELGEADRADRMEMLLDLARSLPALPSHYESQKDEAHRIPECQSPVYMFVENDEGRLRLFADAPIEAPTVRGFVAMLVEGLDGQPLEQGLNVPGDLIERSGLAQILGMQRSSGLHAVLRRLKNMVIRLGSATPPAD